MARKRPSASRAALPQAPDDFTRIHGIGPVTAKHLHGAGIRTFAQLAELSSEAVASLLPNLSGKMVTKQSWIRQARELAITKRSLGTLEKKPVIPTSRQHYENFTLEFLLSEKNKIRRMQVVHVQSRDVDTWTIWDAERLIDFLARHTGVHLPDPKVTHLPDGSPTLISKPLILTKHPSEVITEGTSITAIGKSEENVVSALSHEIRESIPPILESNDKQTSESVHQQQPSPAGIAGPLNQMRLLEWKTFLHGTDQQLHNLRHDQAFDVNLTLDLTNASLSDACQLDFTASLYAKKLGNGHREVIAENQSTMPYANIVDLTIRNASLPQGLYRLEASLTLISGGSSPLPTSNLNASFQGCLFQVY